MALTPSHNSFQTRISSTSFIDSISEQDAKAQEDMSNRKCHHEELSLKALDRKAAILSETITLDPNPARDSTIDLSCFKHGPPPLTLPFSELCPFIERLLVKKGIIQKEIGGPFFIGGSSSHIVGDVRYGDKDICFYTTHVDPEKVIDCFIEFIIMKLWDGGKGILLDAKNRTHQKIIREVYLYKKVLFKDANNIIYGSQITLGSWDFKFLLEPEGWSSVEENAIMRMMPDAQAQWKSHGIELIYRQNVCIFEFHIPCFGSTFFCVDGKKRCNEFEFKQRYALLQQRIYVFKDHAKVYELIWRVFLTRSRNFIIKDDSEVIQCALEKFFKEYPLDEQGHSIELNKRLQAFLLNHYPGDEVGQTFGLLNFLVVMMHSKQLDLRHRYCKALTGAWQAIHVGRFPLKDFISQIESHPHLTMDFLVLLQGALCVSWFRGEAFVVANGSSRPSWHLSCHANKQPQYLAVDTPIDDLMRDFVLSYVALEKCLGETKLLECLNEIEKQFSLKPIGMDSKCRQMTLQKLMKIFCNPPFHGLIRCQQKLNQFWNSVLPQEIVAEHHLDVTLRQYLNELKLLKMDRLKGLVIQILQQQKKICSISSLQEYFFTLLAEETYLQNNHNLIRAIYLGLMNMIHLGVQKVQDPHWLLGAFELVGQMCAWKGCPIDDELLQDSQKKISMAWWSVREVKEGEETLCLRCMHAALLAGGKWEDQGEAVFFRLLPKILKENHAHLFVLAAEIALRCIHVVEQSALLQQLIVRLINLNELGPSCQELLRLVVSEPTMETRHFILQEMTKALMQKNAARIQSKFKLFADAYAAMEMALKDTKQLHEFQELSQQDFSTDASACRKRFLLIVLRINLSLAEKCLIPLQDSMTPEHVGQFKMCLVKAHLSNADQAYAIWSSISHPNLTGREGYSIVMQLLCAILQTHSHSAKNAPMSLLRYLIDSVSLADADEMFTKLPQIMIEMELSQEHMDLIVKWLLELEKQPLFWPAIEVATKVLLQRYLMGVLFSPMPILEIYFKIVLTHPANYDEALSMAAKIVGYLVSPMACKAQIDVLYHFCLQKFAEFLNCPEIRDKALRLFCMDLIQACPRQRQHEGVLFLTIMKRLMDNGRLLEWVQQGNDILNALQILCHQLLLEKHPLGQSLSITVLDPFWIIPHACRALLQQAVLLKSSQLYQGVLKGVISNNVLKQPHFADDVQAICYSDLFQYLSELKGIELSREALLENARFAWDAFDSHLSKKMQLPSIQVNHLIRILLKCRSAKFLKAVAALIQANQALPLTLDDKLEILETLSELPQEESQQELVQAMVELFSREIKYCQTEILTSKAHVLFKSIKSLLDIGHLYHLQAAKRLLMDCVGDIRTELKLDKKAATLLSQIAIQIFGLAMQHGVVEELLNLPSAILPYLQADTKRFQQYLAQTICSCDQSLTPAPLNQMTVAALSNFLTKANQQLGYWGSLLNEEGQKSIVNMAQEALAVAPQMALEVSTLVLTAYDKHFDRPKTSVDNKEWFNFECRLMKGLLAISREQMVARHIISHFSKASNRLSARIEKFHSDDIQLFLKNVFASTERLFIEALIMNKDDFYKSYLAQIQELLINFELMKKFSKEFYVVFLDITIKMLSYAFLCKTFKRLACNKLKVEENATDFYKQQIQMIKEMRSNPAIMNAQIVALCKILNVDIKMITRLDFCTFFCSLSDRELLALASNDQEFFHIKIVGMLHECIQKSHLWDFQGTIPKNILDNILRPFYQPNQQYVVEFTPSGKQVKVHT